MSSYLTMPADFKRETIEKYHQLNQQYDLPVKEVYGSINPSPFGSGRKEKEIPKIGLNTLQEYVELLNKYGISFVYTFNQLCNTNREFTESGIQEVVQFIDSLVKIGVRKFTVAIPAIMDIIGTRFTDVELTVSVIAGIDSLRSVKTFEHYPNVKRVYIKEDLNRDLNLIGKIAQNTNLELATIVNTFCLMNCPFRNHHYIFGSHAGIEEHKQFVMEEYYGAWCALHKIHNKAEVLRMPWIRPEDMDIYIEKGIRSFKISGREMAGADFAQAAEAYMKRSYVGNLVDLFMNFVPVFYNNLFHIDNRDLDGFAKYLFLQDRGCREGLCVDCGYCDQWADKVKMSEEYFNQYKPKFERDYRGIHKVL